MTKQEAISWFEKAIDVYEVFPIENDVKLEAFRIALASLKNQKFNFEQTREQFLFALNSNSYIGICTCEDMVNAVNALEKQIPRKPLLVNGRFECPSCHGNGRALNYYCDMCGQKLDWEEDI